MRRSSAGAADSAAWPGSTRSCSGSAASRRAAAAAPATRSAPSTLASAHGRATRAPIAAMLARCPPKSRAHAPQRTPAPHLQTAGRDQHAA
eukprot:153047-Chlamydomonas_euryale.AAC.10